MASDQKYWVVIPARLSSTRLPRKALHLIAGKPLIAHVVEGVCRARGVEKILVATDHESICEAVQKTKTDPRVECVMTPSDLPSGTDRCLHAVSQFSNQGLPDRVFNIQGDEPLIDGGFVDELIAAWSLRPEIQMLTTAKPLNSLADLQSPHVVKAMLNQRSEAIYFSRFPVPFSKGLPQSVEGMKNPLHHIGIYGFEIEFLKKFCSVGVSSIEQAESLEQLRALQMGASIFVHLTDRHLMGVDTLDDVVRVEEHLKNKRG